jgi:hypothetical protein
MVPSREIALLDSLRIAEHALIVLDDARVPPVQRFVARLAQQNPHLLVHNMQLDHGLAFFYRLTSETIKVQRSALEFAKAWRRYLQARGFAKL